MKKIHFSNNNIKRVLGEHFDINRGVFEESITVSLSNPISFMLHNKEINEGLIKTYPYEIMKRYMCEYFNIPSYYFHDEEKYDGIKCCAIDIPKGYPIIYKEVKRAMNLCGYFVSTEGEYDDFVRLHFEPKFEEEDKPSSFLYHITYHTNEPRIRKIGLKPSRKNIMFNYPDRIYFLTSEATQEDKEYLARMLDITHKRNSPSDGIYIVMKIDLDRIGNNVKFHKDPNYHNSVYTTDNIPLNAIANDVDIIRI